ncbi:hypothetical protein MsAg5_13630 [Methanosarcinaceae archaeon Ag5]|uniref:Uncharacterized protein n=1 Tax=Methanolapillus africanus TaxID=3028297 RepID=A0AAE4MLX9_9EURY|nr:hypothetical protein [Methanosarcinaceae archaeon Ag5]
MADEGKSKIMKFGAVLFIVLMIGSLFVASVALLVNNNPDNPNATNETNNSLYTVPMSEMPGKDINFTYTNLKDGVKHLPSGTVSAQIVNIYPTDNISTQVFPGTTISKVLIGSYPTGILEYYTVSDNNGNVTVYGNKSIGPQYDKYNNYSMLIVNPTPQYLVDGNPVLLSYPTTDLTKRALDVNDGGTNVSTNFDYILSKTDDVSNFEDMIVFRANDGSNYSQYYQRTSILSNETYQLESVFINASAGVKQSITDRSVNGSSNGVTYKISEDGDTFKFYIESTNGVSFVSEVNALKEIINNNTKSSSQ